MSGIANISVSSNVYTAHIELVRAIAKVELVGKNDFVIESVTVKNTPDQGYAFGQVSFSVPGSPTDYPAVSWDPVQPTVSLDTTVYVAENIKEDATKFFVVGTFDGKRAEYTVVLSTTTEGVTSIIDIKRNTHYRVGISPVSEVECKITIEILDWYDVITDDHEIPELDFEPIEP